MPEIPLQPDNELIQSEITILIEKQNVRSFTTSAMCGKAFATERKIKFDFQRPKKV